MSEHEHLNNQQDQQHSGTPAKGRPPQPKPKLIGEPGIGARAALVPNYDFGEKVVGSTTPQTIMPWNLADQVATAKFHISGAGFELLSPAEVSMPPSRTMKGDDVAHAEQSAPKVQFAPHRAGAHHGELIAEIRWNDGYVETKTVALHGLARTLQQAPASFAPVTDSAPRQSQLPPNKVDHNDRKSREIDKAKSENFDNEVRRAGVAARSLAQSQREGVDNVRTEQQSYRKHVNDNISNSILWSVIEVALTLGTAGVAAVVAKTIMPTVLGYLVKKSFKIEEEVVVKMGDFATDFVKEGIKNGGKAAIASRLHGHPSADNGNSQSPKGTRISTDSFVEFFGQQTAALSDQGTANEMMINDFAHSLQPMVLHHPEHATELLKAVAESFLSSLPQALQKQAEATSAQWATALARAKLGTEDVVTAQHPPGAAPLTAVNTRPLRPRGNRDVPTVIDGVLDVYIGHASKDPKVWRAELHGVAQATADRLSKMELLNAGIPIRVVFGASDDRPIIITKDEAGRVRVQNDSNFMWSSEEGSIADAEALIQRIFSQTLESQGVWIHADDDHQKPPESSDDSHGHK